MERAQSKRIPAFRRSEGCTPRALSALVGEYSEHVAQFFVYFRQGVNRGGNLMTQRITEAASGLLEFGIDLRRGKPGALCNRGAGQCGIRPGEGGANEIKEHAFAARFVVLFQGIGGMLQEHGRPFAIVNLICGRIGCGMLVRRSVVQREKPPAPSLAQGIFFTMPATQEFLEVLIKKRAQACIARPGMEELLALDKTDYKFLGDVFRILMAESSGAHRMVNGGKKIPATSFESLCGCFHLHRHSVPVSGESLLFIHWNC